MFFAQFLSSLVKVIVSLRKLVFVLKGRTVQEGRDGPGPWTGQVPGWMAAATGLEFPSDRVGYHSVLFVYPPTFVGHFCSRSLLLLYLLLLSSLYKTWNSVLFL